MPAGLEFRVASRARVIPKICKIQAERVQVLSVAAVILDVLSAVTAGRYRKPNTIESVWIAFGEIQQRIVSRVEFPSSRKCAFHGKRNPMAECHVPAFEMMREPVCLLRDVVDEDRPPGLQNAQALVNPLKAPIQVVVAVQKILMSAITVVLSEVERRVGKD